MNDDYTGMRAMPKDFPLKFVEKTDAEKLEEFKKALRESTIREYEYQKRIKELESLTRWIPVEERLPTFEDADEEGYVFIRERENESPHRTYHTVGRYDSLKVPDYFYTVTHWRRIDTPEGV
jgi:hypothetical protein